MGMSNETELDKKENALTYDKAMEQLYELERERKKHIDGDPSFISWWENPNKQQNLSLEDGCVFVGSTPAYPLLVATAIIDKYNSTKLLYRSTRIGSYLSFVAGASLSSGLALITGLSPLSFVPLAIGTALSLFFDSKFYDGSRKNIIRHTICSIFLSKKSKKAVAKHAEEVQQYNHMKEAFDIYFDLLVKKYDPDKLLKIVNGHCADTGKGEFIVFGKRHGLYNIPKEEYFGTQQGENKLKELQQSKSKELMNRINELVKEIELKEITK